MFYPDKKIMFKVSVGLYLISSCVLGSLYFNPVICAGSTKPIDLLVIDFSEENLKGNMWWNNFLEDAAREGRYLSAGGSIESLVVHLEFDFYSETITGSLSGSRSRASGLTRYDDSFSGGVSGWVRKKEFGGFWFWKFTAEVPLTLDFKLEQQFTNETGTFWNVRIETIDVVANLTGNTYAGEDGIGFFQISWDDSGGYDQGSRGFSIICAEINERGACVLPGEFPKPIDIEITINGPETINKATSEAIFELVTSGKDIEMVECVEWYFYYYDEDFGAKMLSHF